MTTTSSPRVQLIEELKLLLGDRMIDVELDLEHYQLAVDLAFERFRQRSSGAVEESFLFVTIQPDESVYTLPKEVQDVKSIHRRGVGYNTSGGISFDPFEAAFSNVYLLQAGRTGGIVTWDFFSQYQETIGRVFGATLDFTWNTVSKTLKIHRKPNAAEEVAIHVYNARPEIALLTDVYTKPWIRDYALAKCKMMVGEARQKFPSGFAGPGGNVSLNGSDLKQEAAAEFERLEQEILNLHTGSVGMPFIIG